MRFVVPDGVSSYQVTFDATGSDSGVRFSLLGGSCESSWAMDCFDADQPMDPMQGATFTRTLAPGTYHLVAETDGGTLYGMSISMTPI